MTSLERPRPVQRQFLTPGVGVLLFLIVCGVSLIVVRFFLGLAGVTNLDQRYPWGIWIAFDLATGVALAAGGFTTAALVHIFHREDFHVVSRPALLTAMLGYTFAVLGLLVDLGRPYNVWHPILPWMRNPNSVLFEVGMCVMIYLTVLYVEFLPIILERVSTMRRFPALARLASRVDRAVGKTMFLFLIAGVVLSCAHQSSLGALLVIAPSKMHPLWWSPILPLLFLLSAIAVGFPMVIFESLLASRTLGLPAEMTVISKLARAVPALLGLYLCVKVADLLIRDSYVYLGQTSLASTLFGVELLFGVVAPMILLLSEEGRRSRGTLLTASAMIVGGVALNRINVFLVAFQPVTATVRYVPSLWEIVVSIGLVSGLVLCYRIAVIYLPVISQPVMERICDASKETPADLQPGSVLAGDRSVGQSGIQAAGTRSAR